MTSDQQSGGPNQRVRQLLLDPGTWAGMALFAAGYLIPMLAFPDSASAVATTAMSMTIAVLLANEVIPDVQ